MKYLILGGGYVGRRACERLGSLGHEVKVFSRNREKEKTIFYQKEIPSYLIEEGFKTLIFCVAPDSYQDYETTYLDNAKILASSKLERIIYTSSTSVYGEHQGEVVDELTSVSPMNPSASILCETESVLLNSDKSAFILRLGEIIGEGRKIKDRLLKQGDKPLSGDGSSHTNLSPIEDIISAIEFGENNSLQGIYNVVSDLHVTRKELYNQLCPGLRWDRTQKTAHGGNKIVSSEKLKNLGFKFSKIDLLNL